MREQTTVLLSTAPGDGRVRPYPLASFISGTGFLGTQKSIRVRGLVISATHQHSSWAITDTPRRHLSHFTVSSVFSRRATSAGRQNDCQSLALAAGFKAASNHSESCVYLYYMVVLSQIAE